MRHKLNKLILLLGILLVFSGINVSAKEYKTIHIEAEDALYTEPYQIMEGDDASGGKYLKVNSNVVTNTSVTKDDPVELKFEFETDERDVYFVWHRGRGIKTGVSSWTSVDESSRIIVNYKQSGLKPTAEKGDTEAEYEFGWVCERWYPLEAGKHTVNIIHRVKDVAVDCVEITNDPTYTPDGSERFPILTTTPGEGEDSELIFNLPAYTPPNEHPRVEFRKSDLPRIRENLEHPQNKATYEKLLALADTDIGEAWQDILPYGGKSNASTLHGAVIEANAFLYQLNGDVERGKNAIKWARNYISSTGIRHTTSDTDVKSRQGMYLVYIAAKTYDWCYDLLTEDDKKYLQTFMLLRAQFSETGWPCNGYMTSNVNGHALETQLLRETLAAGIAVYDERPDVYNLSAGRILQHIVPVRNITDRSIFQSEGASYGYFRFQYQLESALLFKAMGYENIWSAVNQQYALYGNFYITRPDHKSFQLGDDANEESWGHGTYWAAPAFLAANMYKDPYLKGRYFYDIENGASLTDGISAITPTRHIILNDVNVGVAPMQDLPLSIFANKPGGYMAARTSWETGPDTNSVAVIMNIQEKFLNGHQHKDSGHFDIYYKGLLAVDSGVYEGTGGGYGSVHHNNYARQSIAHNTMLIEDPNEPIQGSSNPNHNRVVHDGGQKGHIGTDYCAELEDLYSEEVVSGEILSHDFGPDPMVPAYTYMKGDMTDAYTDKVSNFQRTFMFLNFFDEEYPAALIVFDDLTTSNKDFKKKWLIHSMEEPEIDEEGDTFTIKRTELCYNGRLYNQTLLPENAKYEVIGGEGREFEVKGQNFPAEAQAVTQDLGKWRIELSPEQKSEQDYFLNVMQIGENNDSIQPLCAEIIENNDEYIGVSIKDRAVYLKKDGKRRAYELSINDKYSDEDCMYIVTSLAEGTWSVFDKNGNQIGSYDVTDEHDSLSFTAKRGAYTLKWNYNQNVKEKDLTLPALLSFEPKSNTDIDVKIDSFYETFKQPYREEDGILYAPVEETLQKLEIEYKSQNGGFSAKLVDSLTEAFISNNSDGAKVFDDILYMDAKKLLPILGAEVKYDSIGKIARISYGRRSIDSVLIHKYDEPGVLKVKKATGSPATTSAAYLAFDGSTTSYWYAPGKGEWVMAELEEPEYLSKIHFYWHQGHLRQETFDILLSNDAVNWTKVYSGISDVRSELGWDEVPLHTTQKYKYIKIVCYGNTSNELNSLREMKIYKSNIGENVVSSVDFELDESAKVYFVLDKDGLNEEEWRKLRPDWYEAGYRVTDNAFGKLVGGTADGSPKDLAENSTIFKEYHLEKGEKAFVSFNNLDELGNYPKFVFVKRTAIG